MKALVKAILVAAALIFSSAAVAAPIDINTASAELK